MRKLVVLVALSLALGACGGTPKDAAETADAHVVTPIPDAASDDGACKILVGDPDLTKQLVSAVAAGRSATEDATVARLQEQIFGVVVANHGQLGSLAGRMVDYLDDTATWSTAAGRPRPGVLTTVAKVRQICGAS